MSESTRMSGLRSGHPRSLFEDSRRFLSEAECRALAERAFSFVEGEGTAFLGIESWWAGELRWARNRVSLSSDRRENRLTFARNLPLGHSAQTSTNQIDDAALAAAVRMTEQVLARRSGWMSPANPPYSTPELPPSLEYLKPEVFSERTYNLSGDARGEIARAMIEPAEAAGMLAAGYLEVRGQSRANLRSEGITEYMSFTGAQCSTTVRDPGGTGSGWAGMSSWDWGRIDSDALGRRALEKCLASRDPVALEPGRYTVILEPQAVHDIVRLVVGSLSRLGAEAGFGPFAAGTAEHPYESKIGLKVMDERITIGCDPMDPDLAAPSFHGFQPVTWVEHGVLKALSYPRVGYSLPILNENEPLASSGYRITPGDVTIEEMIATTRRGLLVTRFSDVERPEPRSLLTSGFTRDGLWLIENGKISKAVKNFRFTESPLFMLNSIEQVGTPAVPVFSPGAPAVVPPLKARDFSFTSLIDAI